ncbi:MAG: putative peptidoglycan lipid flippase [Candidatus Petromonas sp.]|jgi:putative peptidoglycan lipid II flippase|nr:putative peptidoglycan lipid flippase [Candidatus Petromonas sp.]
MSSGRKTVNTVILVICLTIASKFFGFFREVFIAERFGATPATDAYFVALKITAIVFMSVGSAITTTMIPIVVKYLSRGEKDKAFAFANKIFTILMAGALVIVSLGIALSPYYARYIAIGFEGKQLSLTVSLIRIMFPILACVFITYIFVSILQSFGQFSITSIISIPYNFVLIIYLLLFSDKYGIMGLGVVTLIGWIAQFLIQLPYLLKKDFKIKLNFGFKDKDVKSFFKLIWPILLATAVYNVNTLVDSSLASTLSKGKVSALNYAYIIYTAISTTTIYGISTVLFPRFAENISLKDFNNLKKEITSTIKGLIYILLPMTVGLIILRTPIIEVAFRRGAFDERAVEMTRIALAFYSVGMIGFGLQEVFNKGFFALGDTKTPMKMGIFSVIINIVLNFMLIRVMDLGGLALATSIATICNGVLLFTALTRKIGKFDSTGIMKQFIKVAVSASIMAFVVIYSYKGLETIIDAGSLINKGIILAGSVLFGIVSYAALTMLFKVEETKYVIDNYIINLCKR